MATRTANRRSSRTRRQSPAWWKWTKRGLVLFATLFFIGGSVFGLMLYKEYQVAERKISNLDELMLAVQRPPTQIFSADGKLLYHVSGEYRKPVKYEDIPDNVRNAILAAEDKRFFEHPGVDAIALARILYTNVTEQQRQGGSTLTMQLAKLLYTNSERSLKRKMGDMAMALAIERKLTKEEILELYANKVFFGGGAHGIAAAADVYFNKSIKQLTVGEAAMLARCVRRPSEENPFRNPKRAMENRNIVLGIMLGEGMISQEEYNKAKAERYKFKKHSEGVSEQFLRARYFVWHVLETFKQDFPGISLSSGGYKIYTTLDTTMQSVAEGAVKETVAKHRGSGVTTAAFIAMDRDGRVLCEVGGIDFDKNQFNVVTDGYRQPGSAFKPFVYSAAFATGAFTRNDSVSNAKFVWPMPGEAKPWVPKNSNNRYGGNVSIETAFKMSYNVPAARVLERVGPSTALAFARSNFGFTSPHLQAIPSMALGACEVTPLEMAQAYSTFMMRGNRVKPYCITRVVAPDGNILKVYQPEVTVNALDPVVADDIDYLMRKVIESGTGTRANVVPNARGKTGTTSDNKDAWFCGYADGVVGIGWIANEVRREGKAPIYLPMASRIYGGTVTVEFWAKVMKYAQKRFGKQFEQPSTGAIIRNPTPAIPIEEKPAEPDPDDFPPMDERPVEPDPDPPLQDRDPNRKPDENRPPDDPRTVPNQDPTKQPPSDRDRERAKERERAREREREKERERERAREREREQNLVEVEICADTGMRASIYCPETVTRRFASGQEPSRKCSLHGGRAH